MNELRKKFETIPLKAKITITIQSWPDKTTMPATLMEYPVQNGDRWQIKVRLKRQKKLNTFTLGSELLDVTDGWGGER